MYPALLTGGPRSLAARAGIARAACCCLVIVCAALVSACTTGASAILATAKQLYGDSSVASTPALDPKFSYMRVDIAGRVSYLALGYVDALPEGLTEVWYSGRGEVLRIRNGRIVGTTGLTTDWRAVRFSAEPGWPSPDATDRDAESHTFTRERDLMPGYRFGVRDQIERVAIPAPPRSTALPLGAQQVRWYEERSTSSPAGEALPSSRFAVSVREGQAQVVYSEQCLTPDLCLSLQPWTPAAEKAGMAAEGATSAGS